MIFNLSQAAGSAVLTALLALIDAGTPGGTIKLYTGTIPANADTAVSTQVLLGTLTLSVVSGVVSVIGGVPTLTFSAITGDSAADASGTCTWARLADGNGLPIADFDVSAMGGNGFGKLNNVAISVDGPLTAPSMVITA